MANIFFSDAAWDWLIGYPHRDWLLNLVNQSDPIGGQRIPAYQPTVYQAEIPDPDSRLITVTYAIFAEGSRAQRTKILAITWT